jgi:hypothetical protein
MSRCPLRYRVAAYSWFALLACVVVACLALADRHRAGDPTGSIPIANTTTSLADSQNGELSSQTDAVVRAGLPSTESFPACIESGRKGAAAHCVNMCVTLPVGAQLTGVSTFVQDPPIPRYYACGRKSCTGGKGKVRLDPSGYNRHPRRSGERVCWIIRNWHPDLARNAMLRVSFRLPKGRSLSQLSLKSSRAL